MENTCYGCSRSIVKEALCPNSLSSRSIVKEALYLIKVNGKHPLRVPFTNRHTRVVTAEAQ